MAFPSKYDPSYPEAYLAICEEGGSICDFCARLRISRDTFYSWLEVHSEFKEAVNIGKTITEAWLTKMGISGTQGEIEGFNSTSWSMLMRNRCNMTADRKIKIDFTDCKTAQEKFAKIDSYVSQGRLTMTEAKGMSEYIANAVKIEENTILRARIEALEAEVNGVS